VVFPWFKRELTEQYVIPDIPRGRHRFGEIRIRISDMFGFIHKEHRFPVRDELVVYPTMREVHMLGRMSAFDHGEQSAYSFRMKNTNIAIGIREYVPGDKFSWIDWKQTARKNELMTKEFEQEKSIDTMVVLNACAHHEFNLLAFEAAVEVAYSIAQTLYRQSSMSHFISISEEKVHMTLYQDESKTIGLREHLTTIEPIDGVSFTSAFREEFNQMVSGFVVILISTDLNLAFKKVISETSLRMKRFIVIFIQGSKQIPDEIFELVREMRFKGIVVNVLTEKELIYHA